MQKGGDFMTKGELPIGFTLSLAMDTEAMECYSDLPKEKQEEIIHYVSQPGEGQEAKYRIDDMVHQLHNHMIK